MDFCKHRLTVLITLLALFLGCSSQPSSEYGYYRGPASNGARDLPWEMSGEDGEMYLPDIFYADPAQNEQVMPTTMPSGRHQIDRLIYPTIGNPHMFVRNSGKVLVFALRVEPDAIAHLDPKFGAIVPNTPHKELVLNNTQGELAFYLIKREGRTENTGKSSAVVNGARGTYKIIPTSVIQYSQSSNIPEPLRKRLTLRVNFNTAALANVPEGLYDIRFEVKQGAAIKSLAGSNLYEFQYNSVRVFDSVSPKYKILNVTDSQISMGLMMGRTFAKMEQFVKHLNASRDPEITNAAFITFNGDLHNGGSPELLIPGNVGSIYRKEAHAILDALKELNYPIFLTAGNHDGYAAMGHPPASDYTRGMLKAAIDREPKKEWPGYTWETFEKYLDETKDVQGGRHADVFDGQFVRREDAQDWDSYQPIPAGKRNIVLYDGFYQWRRTYGPLYSAWTFGNNFFVNLNTYDLRQHRRSGWGMFTVNYGGGLSPIQGVWLNRILKRAQEDNKDIIVIAHHDPRGGHKGKDYPFYFEQIEFKGFGQSAQNYVNGEIINPKYCKWVPDWAKTEDQELGCMHDGLQEWMRADSEFDCDNSLRKSDGTCDTAKMKPDRNSPKRLHPYYSGYSFLDKLANTSNLRTLLLGHTHFYSIDILQEGEELVPGSVVLDAESRRRYASQDVTNPLRGWTRALFGGHQAPTDPKYDPELLKSNGIDDSTGKWMLHFNAASGHTFDRIIRGQKRELAILRLTSVAQLTSQKFQGNLNFGFSLFDVYTDADERNYKLPQINRIKTFINDNGRFALTGDLVLDRTKRISRNAADNFFNKTFR